MSSVDLNRWPRMRMWRQLAAYGSSEGGARLANWLAINGLAVFLSPSQFGVVSLCFVFERLLAAIGLAGQEKVVVRLASVATTRLDSGPDPTRTALGQTVGNTVLVSGVAGALLVGSGLIAGGALLGIPLFPHLFAICLGIVFFNVHELAITEFRARQLSSRYGVHRVLISLFKLLCVGSILLVVMDDWSYPVGFAVASGAALLPIAIFHRDMRLRPQDLSIDGEHLRFGAPLVLHGLGGMTLLLADRLLIEVFAGIEEVGVYSVAYGLIGLMTLVFGVLALMYEPRVVGQEDPGAARETARRFVIGTTLVTLVGATVLVVASPLLYDLLLADAYARGLELIPILAAGFLAHPLYLRANFLLIRAGQSRPLARATILSAATNLLLNLALIPMLGILGAAIATMASYWLLALSATYFAKSVDSGRGPRGGGESGAGARR